MTKICRWLCIVALAGCGTGTEQGGQLQLKLPQSLREISGLALLSGNRLLAVADERAQIYSIDFGTLQASKFASMGDPAGKGDFEGIALLNDTIYLTTSAGELWQRGLTAAAAEYATLRTGVGKLCEVEGLTAWPRHDVLLMLCKEPRTPQLRGKLAVFAWSVQNRALAPALAIQRPFKDLGLPLLHPSALTFTADQRGLLIVAARERYFVEINLQGDLIRAGPLPNASSHRQAEGVVITPANTLYLADEGNKGRGTVTRYEPSF